MPFIGVGKNSGKVVENEDAFEYALEQIKNDLSERLEFLEWFYSGDWYEENNN